MLSGVTVPPDERRAFLAERRAAAVQRFDNLHSPTYDEHWGRIEPLHAVNVRAFAERLPRGSEVLDAACGTGKYWPDLLAAGLVVTGIDQSSGMLEQATRKHPDVATYQLALQDLLGADALRGRFDGLLCVDALEVVPPEDWPSVVEGLAATLKPGAPAWVTVEQHPDPLPPPADPRQRPDESMEGGSFHHYPSRTSVFAWLEGAGFAVELEQSEGEYWHLVLVRG
jgi:2-polyprenyl-3-methyl-5-hydroxy-6-metoxy-1,4-benzoquinol methylase